MCLVQAMEEDSPAPSTKQLAEQLLRSEDKECSDGSADNADARNPAAKSSASEDEEGYDDGEDAARPQAKKSASEEDEDSDTGSGSEDAQRPAANGSTSEHEEVSNEGDDAAGPAAKNPAPQENEEGSDEGSGSEDAERPSDNGAASEDGDASDDADADAEVPLDAALRRLNSDGPNQAGAEGAPDQVQASARGDSPERDRSAAASAPQPKDGDEQVSEQEDASDREDSGEEDGQEEASERDDSSDEDGHEKAEARLASLKSAAKALGLGRQKVPEQATVPSAAAQEHETDSHSASDGGSSGSDDGSHGEQEHVTVPAAQRRKSGAKSESRAQHMRSPGKLRMGLRAVAGKPVLAKRPGRLGDPITASPNASGERAGKGNGAAASTKLHAPAELIAGLRKKSGKQQAGLPASIIKMLNRSSLANLSTFGKSGTPEEPGRPPSAARKRSPAAAATLAVPRSGRKSPMATDVQPKGKRDWQGLSGGNGRGQQQPPPIAAAAVEHNQDAPAPGLDPMSPVRCFCLIYRRNSLHSLA